MCEQEQQLAISNWPPVLQIPFHTDPSGTYGFSYDNMGRLIGTTTQYSFLPGSTFTNSYTYDAASNRLSLTAPDGNITTYGYDSLNRVNDIANSWAGSFGFGYDALSRRTSLTRPNGVNTSYTYDSVSRLPDHTYSIHWEGSVLPVEQSPTNFSSPAGSWIPKPASIITVHAPRAVRLCGEFAA